MMEYINSHPEQLAPSDVSSWSLMPAYFAAIDGILRESVRNQLASEFMARPTTKRMEPSRSARDKPKPRILELNSGREISVHRLGFAAMRRTGEGIWGKPKDRKGALAVLRRAVELIQISLIRVPELVASR
jgi:hypothetical protein